jgi:hypothetical protein
LYVYTLYMCVVLCNIITETLNKGNWIAFTLNVQSYVAMYCAWDVNTEFGSNIFCKLTVEWNHRRRTWPDFTLPALIEIKKCIFRTLGIMGFECFRLKDHFSKQMYPIGLCNGDSVCFLYSRIEYLNIILIHFRPQTVKLKVITQPEFLSHKILRPPGKLQMDK